MFFFKKSPMLTKASSAISPSFSGICSFRNHSNMLILFRVFQDSFINIKFERKALGKKAIICKIINIFTVILDQFNAFLLNESIYGIKVQ